MAVMVTLTLKIDAATYDAMHDQMLPIARAGGMLFHSGREVDGGIAVVDFWPTAEAFHEFFDGPVAEGMTAIGVERPDDIAITQVLRAES
jgi:hypothetical protein